MALPAAAEIAWARQRRAHARAAGGVFDLVLPLREGTGGPPLFCLPPLVAMSWCYLALFPHIEPAYPIYGVQSRGLGRPEPLPVDMADLARDVTDQIRRVQPHGPYHLFGWSLGGNTAYAVAEELQRRGHEIGLLVMGDTTPTLPGAISPEDDNTWFLCNFILREFNYQPVIQPDDPAPVARMLALIRARPGLSLDDWPDRRVLALPRVIRNNIAVSRTHRPGRIRCRMLFLSSTVNERPTEVKVATWRDLVDGPIDVVELDCRHEHMLLPEPVARIGAEITARLPEAAENPVIATERGIVTGGHEP